MNSSLSNRWLATALLLLASGCLPAPEVGEEVDAGEPPVNEPADAGVTFTEVNQTILQPNCATSGCHAGNPPARAPMSLEAEVAYASLVNVPAKQVASLDRVEPGAPANSYLIHKLKGTAASVGGTATRMPLTKPALSAEQIAKIEEWITRGAPND